MSAKDAETEANDRAETRRLVIRAKALKDEPDLRREVLETAQFERGYN